MTKDKERDDALIAEARKNLDGTAHGINEYMREVLRLERSGLQPAPKPDRAEKLWWTLCYCDNQTAIALLRSTMDELRAEWEAERPAVVVPDDVRAWALHWSDSKSKAGVLSRFILSLDGAKGGE